MVIFIAIVVFAIVIFKMVDNYMFSVRVERFVSCADEFFAMYKILEKSVTNGSQNDDEVTEFTFEGQNFGCDVYKGDFKGFYRKMLVAISYVEDQYECITKEDFNSMEHETYMEVQHLHERLVSQTAHIRCEYWKVKNA